MTPANDPKPGASKQDPVGPPRKADKPVNFTWFWSMESFACNGTQMGQRFFSLQTWALPTFWAEQNKTGSFKFQDFSDPIFFAISA